MSTKIIPFPAVSRVEGAEGRAPDVPAPPPAVTFTRPFQLPGMDAPHAPGTFEVRTQREQLDVTWAAYRITTSLLLTHGATTEAIDVTAADLDAALREDARELG